ncbi:MAG: hypothetical protein PVS2B2_02640 [Candidatus Acidiferrum sp.]
MELANELEAILREFFASGPVEIRENDGRVAPTSAISWEIRGSGEKPLLHLWAEQYNLTRRVLAITDHSDHRLALAVERFGRAKPERLEFLRREFERSLRERTREEFCARFHRILAEQFPDEALESFTISRDLEYSLSGNYARGIVRRKGLSTAILAVPEGESQESVENSLTYGLLWLDRARQSSRGEGISGLRLILPKGNVASVAHRMAALHAQFRVELYVNDPALETVEKIDPRDAGNISTWLISCRETQSLLDRARASLEPIIALAPKAISVHASAQPRELFLRFRGLPFARWNEGQILISEKVGWRKIVGNRQLQLKSLVHDLEFHRSPLANDSRHALYRAQAERWLEFIVREDISRIDAALDARFVYSQVFTQAGGDHGILDLLGVTRFGRLAIVELKASEHIHLPIQAADYWLRIRRHLAQGDFSRFGYFPGLQLQTTAPIVYLVAPALRFHPATDALLRYLTPELEVVRVGLAESWREGLRVVMRQ